MMIWIDLETTGLSAAKGYILEIGCIITDDKLNEVARDSCVVQAAPLELLFKAADDYVKNMHTENGLWDDLRAGLGVTLGQAEQSVHHLVAKHSGEEKHPLCGNSVQFDRKWMNHWMARLESALHYRNIDVSGVGELHKRFGHGDPHPKPAGGVRHRCIADLESSIAQLRYYLKEMGWVCPPWAAS